MVACATARMLQARVRLPLPTFLSLGQESPDPTLSRRGYAFLSAREEGAARHAALAAEAGGALHADGGHGLRCYG